MVEGNRYFISFWRIEILTLQNNNGYKVNTGVPNGRRMDPLLQFSMKNLLQFFMKNQIPKPLRAIMFIVTSVPNSRRREPVLQFYMKNQHSHPLRMLIRAFQLGNKENSCLNFEETLMQMSLKTQCPRQDVDDRGFRKEESTETNIQVLIIMVLQLWWFDDDNY